MLTESKRQGSSDHFGRIVNCFGNLYLNDYHALIDGNPAVRNDRYRKIRAYAEKFNSDGLFDERVFYGEGIRKVLCHFCFIVKDVRSELDNPLTGASVVCFGPLRTTSDYINVSYESDDLFGEPMKYVYCCKSQFLVLDWDKFTFELHCSEFSSLERERIKGEQAIPLHECVLVLDICCDQGL